MHEKADAVIVAGGTLQRVEPRNASHGDHIWVTLAIVVDVCRRAVTGVLLECLALVDPVLAVVGGTGRDDRFVGVLRPLVEVAGE